MYSRCDLRLRSFLTIATTLTFQAGVDGAIFIHASGFIGGHATREGAIAMAIKVSSFCLARHRLLSCVVLFLLPVATFCHCLLLFVFTLLSTGTDPLKRELRCI